MYRPAHTRKRAKRTVRAPLREMLRSTLKRARRASGDPDQAEEDRDRHGDDECRNQVHRGDEHRRCDPRGDGEQGDQAEEDCCEAHGYCLT